MLCLLLLERKKEREKKKRKKEKWTEGGKAFFPQGWTHLAGCVVWDFPGC
jgi:hypothetical protein